MDKDFKPNNITNDLTKIFGDYIRSPLGYLQQPFQRPAKLLFFYGAIIFLVIGLLGMVLSLMDGMGDVGALLFVTFKGSLISYAHLLLICLLIFLFFRHALKQIASNQEWVSLFFLASLPYWTACIVMNFLSRTLLAIGVTGLEIIFYSYIFMECLRLGGLYVVLHHRFEKVRKNVFAWLCVFLIFFIVNYEKLSDVYRMLNFDMHTLPMQ